jgi:alkylhydroperoxidase/carboxymuconolactone decarboxylase family protein YurZ
MKTNGVAKAHDHSEFWLKKAWPEGAAAFHQLSEKAFGAGAVDAKTKAMIQLACVSLLRCKHCVDGTVGRLKNDFKVTDREIAEVMMVASYTAAGTNMAWANEVFDEHISSK